MGLGSVKPLNESAAFINVGTKMLHCGHPIVSALRRHTFTFKAVLPAVHSLWLVTSSLGSSSAFKLYWNTLSFPMPTTALFRSKTLSSYNVYPYKVASLIKNDTNLLSESVPLDLPALRC